MKMRSEPFIRAAALLGLALLAPLAARAADIDYDARRPAALRPCDESRHHGRVDAARSCYQPLLRSADPLVRAEAAFALGDIRTANELFRAAVAANDGAAFPRLRWGRMFLFVGSDADAQRLFTEALERNQNDIGVQLAIASMGVQRFDGEAGEELQKLVAANPELIEAHLLAARLAIERGRYDEAQTQLQRAQQLATSQKLPPLEPLALQAAIEVMRGRDPAAPIREALAYNPRYGAMFELLGHFEIMRRLYKEADVWYARAVQVEPDLWSARREYGLNLLRLDRVAEARPHLVAAFEGDPFNPTTVNTLRLLDSLDKFDVVRVAQPAMALQLRKDEVPTLGPYVQQLTADAMASMTRRYGYTPSGPVRVELYPDHDDFAVRTAGLPGIGLLGVTFGNLVLMDSPAGRQRGDFHWGSTLWHELAHVYTLGITQNRVPRWVSEGISVYEEWTSGPTPGVSVSPDVLESFTKDLLLPVATLDDGFMRPTYENQVQVSYQQGGLVIFFAAQRWGFPRVVNFLRAFDGRTSIETALRAAFDVSPADFDKQFNAFMHERFAAYIADPARWKQLMQRGHAMLDARNWSAAREAAQAAILMLPEFTGGGSAYEILADTEEGAGNPAAAVAALQAWRKAGGWDPTYMRKLGALLLAAKRNAEAAEVFAAVNYADPLAVDGHDQLGRLLLAQRQAPAAQREYEVLLALQPQDTAAANYGLARALQLAGDLTRARRHLLQSLEVAPNYRPAQRMLLEMTGDRTP
jgi:tetratricopeptide (TPR) repeat protein